MTSTTFNVQIHADLNDDQYPKVAAATTNAENPQLHLNLAPNVVIVGTTADLLAWLAKLNLVIDDAWRRLGTGDLLVTHTERPIYATPTPATLPE